MANENVTSGNRLQELTGSDFEIVDGQPDIRGWDIKDTQGRTFGEVDELIFDVVSRKVRYMVVDLDDNDFDLKSRKVLVPIGMAELHERDDDVILPNISGAQLEVMPEYHKHNIMPDTENAIRNALGGSAALGAAAGLSGAGASDDFYNHEHFNESNLYNKRRAGENATAIPVIEEQLKVDKDVIETGGVRLHSTIVERPVEESVNLREEHVTVERNPVDRPATPADLDALGATTIEMKEHAEVPVVSKEARVIEEVSFGKEVDERHETIRDTVRKTEVDVEDLDKDSLRNTSDTSSDKRADGSSGVL